MELNDRTLRTLTRMNLDDPRHRAVVVEALPLVIARMRELAAYRLLAHIADLSEKYTHQPWAPGIEFAIWRSVQEGPETADEQEINLAEQLSEEAGGWWHRPDATEAVFVPLDAWNEMYESSAREETTLRTENARLQRTIDRLQRQINQGEPE